MATNPLLEFLTIPDWLLVTIRGWTGPCDPLITHSTLSTTLPAYWASLLAQHCLDSWGFVVLNHGQAFLLHESYLERVISHTTSSFSVSWANVILEIKFQCRKARNHGFVALFEMVRIRHHFHDQFERPWTEVHSTFSLLRHPTKTGCAGLAHISLGRGFTSHAKHSSKRQGIPIVPDSPRGQWTAGKIRFSISFLMTSCPSMRRRAFSSPLWAWSKNFALWCSGYNYAGFTWAQTPLQAHNEVFMCLTYYVSFLIAASSAIASHLGRQHCRRGRWWRADPTEVSGVYLVQCISFLAWSWGEMILAWSLTSKLTDSLRITCIATIFVI